MKRSKQVPKEIELVRQTYQPSKAELEEPIVFPEGATPEALARAVMQPVNIKFVPRPKR